MFKINLREDEYEFDIRVNKYGAILEIFQNGLIWYTDVFDLSMLDEANGSLTKYITNEILHYLELEEEMDRD